MPKGYGDVVINNPQELGAKEISLLEEGLKHIIHGTGSTPTDRLDARELLDLLINSHTIWLDLNE